MCDPNWCVMVKSRESDLLKSESEHIQTKNIMFN